MKILLKLALNANQLINQSILQEGLMEVNRQLVDTASKENLPLKLTGKPGRVSAEQLENTLTLFK